MFSNHGCKMSIIQFWVIVNKTEKNNGTDHSPRLQSDSISAVWDVVCVMDGWVIVFLISVQRKKCCCDPISHPGQKELSDYLSNDKKAGTFNGRLSCQDKLDKRNTASHWSCRRFSLVSGLFIQSFNFLFQKPLLKNEKGVIWFSIDRNTRQFSFSLSKERSEIWKALRDGGRLDFPGRSWPRLLKWDQCSSCTWKASLARASSSSPRAHGCPCLELRLSPNTSM